MSFLIPRLRDSLSVAAFVLCGACAIAPGAGAQENLAAPEAAGGAPSAFRACGTPDPSPLELQGVSASLRRWADENVAGPRASGTIQVAFHVITNGSQGRLTRRQIADQIEALNRDYAGSGYRFALASVDRTDNAQWFKMEPGSARERHAKQALAIDPAHRLNLYTCAPVQNLMGWSSLPSVAAEDSYLNGIFVHFASLPGGALVDQDLGKTATHQVGHYLGLTHPFPGDCAAPGDAGCLDAFTPAQVDRMHAVVQVYRPSLFRPSVAPVRSANESLADPEPGGEGGRVLAFRGAFPNPFRVETAFRFTLPTSQHVTIKVYSVTGQLVQTIVDAELPPGDHSAQFNARDLPSGMYFASVRAGQVEMHKSVILIR